MDMTVFSLLCCVATGPQLPAAAPVDPAPAVFAAALDTVNPLRGGVRLPIPVDTPRARPRVIEVSDWYARRLTIHRYTAYGTIPVFAAQWVAGKKLYDESRAAPTWAKTVHRVGATTLAGMFTVNTVTGLWNWWDSRMLAQGRVLRTVHMLSMLTADAAFTYAGAKLSNEAETDASKRRLHRTVALSAMGLTVVSGTAMKLWNR
jgi:hypothetical protein